MASIGEQVKSVIEALTPLANKLGQGAEQVYRIYVTQSIAEGIAMLVGAAFLVTITILAAIASVKLWPTIKRRDLGAELTIFWTFTGIIALVAIPLLVIHGMLHVLSPEYYAIQNILMSIR